MLKSYNTQDTSTTKYYPSQNISSVAVENPDLPETRGQSQGRQGPKMSPRAPSAQAGKLQVLYQDEVRIQQGDWNQGRVRDSNLTASFPE